MNLINLQLFIAEWGVAKICQFVNLNEKFDQEIIVKLQSSWTKIDAQGAI